MRSLHCEATSATLVSSHRCFLAWRPCRPWPKNGLQLVHFLWKLTPWGRKTGSLLHLQTTSISIALRANTAAEGLKPMAHEESRSRDRATNPSVVTAGSKMSGTRERTASALRGFVVTPEFILQIAPQFRDWVGSGRPKWGELEEAATFVRSDLGISLHAWGQACVVLGRMEAVSVLAAIAARQAVGKGTISWRTSSTNGRSSYGWGAALRPDVVRLGRSAPAAASER